MFSVYVIWPLRASTVGSLRSDVLLRTCPKNDISREYSYIAAIKSVKDRQVTALHEEVYASMLAYVAFFSINSRRGPTSSPMSIENM